MQLTDEERQVLLKIARDAITATLERREYSPGTNDFPEILNVRCGAFVTLHEEGTLRGCIGYVESEMSLAETVADVAVKAALEDPRFFPVEVEELPLLEIEISVLSPLEIVRSPDEIIIGLHGLYVYGEFHKGLLLPQVAPENNWNRDTFISFTGRKAGIPDYYIGYPGITVYKFTADVFHEDLIGRD
jgi:AmmeMemoRadiSam system protein A